MRKCLPKPSLPFDRTESLAWLEFADGSLFRPYMAFVPFFWRKSFNVILRCLGRSRRELLERADGELTRCKLVPAG